MKLREWLKSEELNEGMMSPMGTGKVIDVEGTIAISRSDKNKYSNSFKSNEYYNTVADVSRAIMKGLKPLGITALAGGSEEWTGGFYGSPKTEKMEMMKLELVKDGKEANKNRLIVNIYKMPSGKYELNTYIS